MPETPTTPPAAPPVTAANSHDTELSPEDRAFVESYRSAADEMDAADRTKREAAQERPTVPPSIAALSPEDRVFVESYQSAADEMDAADHTREQGPSSPHPEANRRTDNAPVADARQERIEELRQIQQPHPQMHYTIDNQAIRQSVDEHVSGVTRRELHGLEREQAEELRREAFMRHMHGDDPEREREDEIEQGH